MKAAFVLTAGDPTGYVLADFLLRSIRTTMPGVEVTQLTDATSPVLVGVDAVQRRPVAPIAAFIAEHWAALEDGDWLLVDSDVVVQKDVRPVFDQLKFDLAVATREGTLASGEDAQFMRRMPFNCGVVYSRSAAGRRVLADRVRQLSVQDQAWLGIQLVMPQLRPLILYNTFNFPPRTPDDSHVPSAHVVHYKGPWRKRLLLDRIYQETVCS